ncbi:hypothetical protein [Streptomyces sp. C10]|uniref:hypothetical protein n=1 Tax=Streptomyces sp. C10 TaxID=531941 RepID=UPI00397F5314
MADGRRLSGDERTSIAAVRGEFTLDIPVGPLGKPKEHRCRLLIVPPLVSGALTRIKTCETVSAKGFFAQRERRSYSVLPPVVEGELTLVLEKNGAEKVIPFDTDYWGSPSKAAVSLKEGFSGRRSDDLLRHLARIVVGAEEDLAVTRRICAGLAGRDGPEDLLRHAGELWNQARLLLLLGDVREAAFCAVEGADRVRCSGIEPDSDMAESGSALTFVLTAHRHAEAAGRVRDAIDA